MHDDVVLVQKNMIPNIQQLPRNSNFERLLLDLLNIKPDFSY